MKSSWAQRFDEQVRQSPFIILLVLLASTIAAVGTVSSCASGWRNSYDDHFRWRQAEYDRISELHAGVSLQKFEEILGSPTFVRTTADGLWTESTFRRRDYWVQTVSDRSGSVGLMAITSCDDSFQPEFGSILGKVKLRETTLDDPDLAPSRVRYSQAGATANSFFFDEYYLGNPGFYKTYFVGINDTCASRFPMDIAVDAFLLGEYVDREFDPGDSTIAAFRSNAVANTYGETAALSDPPIGWSERDKFQVGVDRILARTIP